MPTSRTKELAKKLGLLRKRKAENGAGNNMKRRKGQLLSYVIVIDFESTCWKDKKGAQEIIEFPAVLLDLQTGDIVAEFQQYVQPQENPILSDFCKELTGISQAQVNGGAPLPTCLYLFGKWVTVLSEEKGVCLMEPGQQYGCHDMNLCALATWSDWDLGVCLQYECRRKQIRKPVYFDQWIDLRVVYKQFYDRKPSGLCGSLEDLGIPFTGREHCGLDDARNTAKLCYRLVKDGCRLNITKSLCKRRVIRAPLAQGEVHKENAHPPNALSEEDSTNGVVEGRTQGVTSCREQTGIIPSKPTERHSKTTGSELDINRGEAERDTTGGRAQGEMSLVNQTSIKYKDACTPSSTIVSKPEVKNEKSHNCKIDKTEGVNGISLQGSGSAHTCTINTAEQREEDWTLLDDDSFLNATIIRELEELEKNNYEVPTVPSSSGHQDLPTSNITTITRDSETGATPSRSHFLSHIAPVTLLPQAQNSVQPQLKTTLQQQEATTHLSMPSSFTLHSPLLPISLQQHQPLISSSSLHQLSTYRHHTCSSTTTSETSNDVFRTPSTTEWMKVKAMSPSLLSSHNSPQPFNGGKLTPPLCNCGKRAKRKLVTSPGPNQGKPFFSCPAGRESGCQYFRWENTSPHGAAHSSTVDLSTEYT